MTACIRCGTNPATRAFLYCEACWLALCDETPAPEPPSAADEGTDPVH